MTHIKYLLNCKKFISLMILFSFFDNFGMQKTESEGSQNEDNKYNNPSEDEETNFPEIKVLFLGDSGVGKTCIFLKLLQDTFKETQQPTIAPCFQGKKIKIGDQTIKVIIWDISGQEKYKTVTKIYYNNVQLVFLVYSVTDRNSFESLGNWLKEVKIVNQNAKFLLVGNKSDVSEDKRTVTKEEGRNFADEHNMEFVEVSAKTGEKISDKRFVPFIKKFLEEEKETEKIPENSSSMSYEEKTNASFSDECCSCCPC